MIDFNVKDLMNGEELPPVTEEEEAEVRKFLIDQIISFEWDMFQQVNNEGGRASCQDDPETFRIMRGSQFSIWPTDMILLYLQDLSDALENGRNLVFEKYAYMMELTAPEYYEANFREVLPFVAVDAERCIKNIIAAQLAWGAEMDEKYPIMAKLGRPAEQVGEDGTVSRRIYAYGELRTYSVKTLQRYDLFVKDAQERGVNLAIAEREEMVKAYGYESLDAAEAYYTAQRKKAQQA